MTTNEITSQDIAAWIENQTTKVLRSHKYASLTVECNAFRDTVNRKSKFRIWCSSEVDSGAHGSIEECFERLAKYSPEAIAEQKRKAAAKLLAEADEILAKAATGGETPAV